jgi:hypothetical protein
MIRVKISTKVGVEIGVFDEVQNSTILMFDKPVRGIQLNHDESSNLGLMLLKVKTIKPTHIIQKLKMEGFFDTPKNFNQIRLAFEDRGVPIKAGILGGILAKLVERGKLKKKQSEKGYQYF